MTQQPGKKLDIVEIAMAKRKISLYEKVSQGKALTRAELRELKKFEDGQEKDPGVLETWADIQKVFGISEMTVSRWVKDGMPQRPDGTWSVMDIQTWKHERELSKHNKSSDGKREDWDERYRKAKALEAEQRLKERSGELISLSEIESGLVQVMLALKQSLMRLPHILATRLENKDAREIMAEVTEVVTGLITSMAQERIFAQYHKEPEAAAKEEPKATQKKQPVRKRNTSRKKTNGKPRSRKT